MKSVSKLFACVAFVTLFVSCSKSTEKYASKEHGIKFNAWELNYHADDDDVYWPSIKLTEPTEGESIEIESEYSWSGRLLSRDTTTTGARFYAYIYNVKSKNDAKYYNTIRFKLCKDNNRFRSGLEHCFVFKVEQKDSISFTAKSNDDQFFVPNREQSEEIIQLFCGTSPVDIIVTCRGSSVEGTYLFTVEGSPKLSKAIEINHDRRQLAEKESKKAESKFEKELEELFY